MSQVVWGNDNADNYFLANISTQMPKEEENLLEKTHVIWSDDSDSEVIPNSQEKVDNVTRRST